MSLPQCGRCGSWLQNGLCSIYECRSVTDPRDAALSAANAEIARLRAELANLKGESK